MRFLLKINGHELEYIKEDGIEFSKDSRNERSVTTVDGVLHKKWKDKDIIKVSMPDMDDNYYTEIMSFLKPNPADIYYTDFVNPPIDKKFYIQNVSKGVKKVKGGISIISGFSFELMER